MATGARASHTRAASRKGAGWTPTPVPRDRSRVWLQRVLALLTIALGARYLLWRATSTDNPAAHGFWVLFLITEALGYLSTAGLMLVVWRQRFWQVPEPLEGRTVDVFITTFNEPIELLRDTLRAATEIRYPHRTLLLDDGNRADVATLAAEFGAIYLGRADNVHAKAGNLNNGLAHSTAEFIVTLDADHVPLPGLIDELLGFFREEAVGIVQANQDCYNLDSFQHEVDWRAKSGWQMQELFFNVIQPAKDGFNATIYCGSPAMLRRRALDEIGGFATGTITEDLHTGLRLQKRGWRVRYVNRSVARGLAAQTFAGFASQWRRWGIGSTQVLRMENPLLGRGLSLGQRFCYLTSYEYNVVFSWVRLLSVATVVFASFTGIFPLLSAPLDFALFYLPFLATNLAATSLLSGNWRTPFLMERYNFVKIHATLTALSGYFTRTATFQVTPKSRAPATPLRQVMPYVGMLFLVYTSVVWAVVQAWQTNNEGQFWAYIITATFGVYFFAVTSPAVARVLERREARATYRFPQDLDIRARYEVQRLDASGQRRLSGITFARNLNRRGVSLTLDEELPIGSFVQLELALAEHRIAAFGQVAWTQPFTVEGRKRCANGIRFLVADVNDGDAIMMHMFRQIAPKHGQLLTMTSEHQEDTATAPAAGASTRDVSTSNRPAA
ncbi:MAG: glycosyltransferase [Gemmatimonadetes bacterium]|nr:glycosyltransferase [Gemmatimonadota bacterium]